MSKRAEDTQSAQSVKHWSDREIVDEAQSNSLLNRVRKLLSSSAAEIEQACAQRRMPGPIQIRRMEFAAAEKIIAVIKAEEDAVPISAVSLSLPDQMYACGYEVHDNEFGMFAGPTPSLRQILSEIVDGDDSNQAPAYVLKIEAGHEPEKIARWNYEISTWEDIDNGNDDK